MIIGILILSLVARLVNLGQSLWLDEAITAVAVKNNSLIQLVANFSPGDFHPPLYYLLLKLWTDLFGYGELILRLPSVIFGILTVYFVYKLGGKKAALLMSVNPLAVYYSQEARMYCLATLLVTAAGYFFLKKKTVPFVASFVAAMYTDYLPWLMLPVFWSWRPLMFLIPLAPLLAVQLRAGFSVSSEWGGILGSFNLKNFLLVPVKFIIGRITLENKLLYGLASISVVAVHGWALLKARTRFYWLWFLGPLILGGLISLKTPIFSYFRFLFVLPAFILLLGEGLEKRNKLFAVIFLIQLGALMIFNVFPNFWREDWKGATKYFQSEPGLVLIPNVAQAAALDYYSQKYTDVFTPARTVFLLRYVQEISDPRDLKRKRLEDGGYRLAEIKNFNGVVVWKYDL
jgi:hypothetical protein